MVLTYSTRRELASLGQQTLRKGVRACVRQDPAGCLRVTRVRASVAPLCLAVFLPVCSGRGRYPEACL